MLYNRAELNRAELTLDLKIAPLVREVVTKMLLSESDVRDTIEAAVKQAVDNFDWRRQIQEEVSRTIREKVTTEASHLISNIFWDKELQSHFRKAIGKALIDEGKR